MKLSGKKTYITGAGMALYGIAGLLGGQHDANAAFQLVAQGLAFIFLRQAVGGAS